MAFKRLVIAVAVFAIFVAGAFTAFQVADLGQDAAASEPRNQTNEQLVQEYDAWQYVDFATREYTAGFDENVTVENQSGYELTEGEDYEWNSTDGTILFKDTQNTQEGNTSTIDYTYQWNTQRVREVSGPIRTTVEAIGRTGFLAGGVALVVFLLGFGGFVASKFTNTGGPPGSNR